MTVRRNWIGLALALAVVATSTWVFGEDSSPSEASTQAPLIVHEYRYRLSGAIRPLLFWIGDDDVGAARVIRRDEANYRHNYELLIGSDPKRVPRGINRWGWVWEEQRPNGATQMGLVRKIDEKTFEDAEAKVGFENEFVFKAIRTDIADGRARAVNTVWQVRDDYTYYDLNKILRIIQQTPQTPPKVNEGEMPPGTHPGLLFAISDLVDRAVAAATRDPRELLENVTTHYNFNAVVCDMTLRKTEWEESKEYGNQRYERLIRMEFESYDPNLKATEQFILVCGTEGKWKSVPVYMKYQPKWWFRTEGVIDESQVFVKPQQQTLNSEPRAQGGAR